MSRRPRHIAIIAPPTPGHIDPLQVVARELVKTGSKVTFVQTAGVGSLITDRELGFAPIAGTALPDRMLEGYLARLADPTGLSGVTRMIAATARMTAGLLDRAPEVLTAIAADAIVADSAEPAGALIAQRLGLPHVVSVTGLPLLEEESVPPPFLGWRYRSDRLGRFRNNGGYRVSGLLMRPIARVLEQRRRAWGLAGRCEPLAWVAQCPHGLDYPRDNLPSNFHYGAPWRAASSARFTPPHDARPLIFCSLGSLQGSRRKLLSNMSEACAALGARAVIGHAGGLSPDEEAALPGDPLVRPFWPQRGVLPHCVAALTHGGFNTVLDALAAETPIVALPIAFEQPGTAARLARIGAGKVVPHRRASPRRLAQALEEVILNPAYRRAASRIAAEMASLNGASRAANVISAALSSAF